MSEHCFYCDGPCDHRHGAGSACGDCCADHGHLAHADKRIYNWVKTCLEAKNERIAKLEAELAEKQRVLDLLLDPHAVFINIKRGTLPLTKAQAIHIAGLPANVEEELAALRALMELASADIVFFHSLDYGPFARPEEGPAGEIGFSILVNDLFYPAADAEGFGLFEAVPLLGIFRKEGQAGVIRWVQQKRDNQPLQPKAESRIRVEEAIRTERDALREKVNRLEEHEVKKDCDGQADPQ